MIKEKKKKEKIKKKKLKPYKPNKNGKNILLYLILKLYVFCYVFRKTEMIFLWTWK